jgi:hypothetical protein
VQGVAGLGLAAQADHHQKMGVGPGHPGGQERQAEKEGAPSAHASPRHLRYPHSVEIRPTRARNSTGMSHRSFRSTTAAPAPL